MLLLLNYTKNGDHPVEKRLFKFNSGDIEESLKEVQ